MSRITNYPFDAAYSHLIDVYGVEMNEDDFESIAYVAWQKIGNKECRTYRAVLHPQPDSNSHLWVVPVPCNCDIIEAITNGREDVHLSSNKYDHPNLFKASTEAYIESGKHEQPLNYISGGYVHYERVGDMLYFNEAYPELFMLYKGVHLDDNGLPYLNYKEVDAIAAYCAYVTMFKKAIRSMDANAMLVSAVLKQDWEKKCSQARVPEKIDQNEMDHILDAHSSWNRKVYGQSYKVDMR